MFVIAPYARQHPLYKVIGFHCISISLQVVRATINKMTVFIFINI